jgi:hypothetical protein
LYANSLYANSGAGAQSMTGESMTLGMKNCRG